MKNILVSQTRFGWVAGVVVLSFLGVLGRLGYLHTHAQESFTRMAQENRKQFRVLHARRGNIVDAQGQLLASTRPVVDIGVDPLVFEDKDVPRFRELGALLGQDPEALKALCMDGRSKRRRWVKLAEGVEETVHLGVKELDIKGVYGNLRHERVYPAGSLAAHAIGFVNKEENACMGVEHAMDFYLRGHPGWIETEKDGKRREIAHTRMRCVPATEGFHAQLSIDAQIQALCEEEIQALIKEYNPLSVCIIASDPASGRILGLANAPTFDLNAYGQASLDSQRNRALSDVYEPGSCFKVVTMAGALEHKCVNLNESFDCSQNILHKDGRDIKLPKDHRPLGTLSGEAIFVKSSNRGMAHLGLRMGAEAFYALTAQFGFGERSGLGLTGEVPGILHPVKRWDGLTLTRMPMGHAHGVTALQMHMAMSAIASDGLLMRPQIVTDILGHDMKSVLHFDPIVRRRVCSAQTAQTLKHLLLKAAGREGTSFRAEIPGFDVALKSGTSQKLIGKRYSRNHHVASCSGFFPTWNPRVCISIVVDEPHLAGCGYGGVVAAPAFKRLALKLIPYMKIEASMKSRIAMRAKRPPRPLYREGFHDLPTTAQENPPYIEAAQKRSSKTQPFEHFLTPI